MAYVKKKDRLLNELVGYIKSNGKAEKIQFGECDDAIVWNERPICVQDVCVDNICLFSDGMLVGCNIEDGVVGTHRYIATLKQKYIEGILHDVIVGYEKKQKH